MGHFSTGWLRWQIGHCVVDRDDDDAGGGDVHSRMGGGAVALSVNLSVGVSARYGRRDGLLGGRISVVTSAAATLAV